MKLSKDAGIYILLWGIILVALVITIGIDVAGSTKP